MRRPVRIGLDVQEPRGAHERRSRRRRPPAAPLVAAPASRGDVPIRLRAASAARRAAVAGRWQRGALVPSAVLCASASLGQASVLEGCA